MFHVKHLWACLNLTALSTSVSQAAICPPRAVALGDLSDDVSIIICFT